MKTLLVLLLLSYTLLAQEKKNLSPYEIGEEIYEQTCSSCHGDDGETNTDIMLTVQPRKLTKTILTKEQSFEIIKEGAYYWGAHSDFMPAFKYVFTDSQIEAVSTYITQKFNSHRDKRVEQLLHNSKEKQLGKEKMLSLGKKIFHRNCSLCHGVTGNGESEYVEQSKKNKDFIYPYNLRRTLLDEDQIYLYAKYGGHYWGTVKDDMPSWKKKYNNTQLRSVAKYVTLKIKNIGNK